MRSGSERPRRLWSPRQANSACPSSAAFHDDVRGEALLIGGETCDAERHYRSLGVDIWAYRHEQAG
jgi:hypothetical protein